MLCFLGYLKLHSACRLIACANILWILAWPTITTLTSIVEVKIWWQFLKTCWEW